MRTGEIVVQLECVEEAVELGAGKPKEEILEDLGSHLVSLATKNKISATEASALVNKCRRGGINIKVPFKPAEGNPKKRAIWGFKEEPGKKEPGDGTAAKSLTRWLKRENKWAPLYWADIPLWNPAKKQKVMSSHPFLLPHDWLEFYLLQEGACKEGQPEEGSFYEEELKKPRSAWGQPGEGMFPLGLHGDGVPYQGRMNQSTLDFVTVNFPLSKLFSQKRFLVTCLDSKWSLGHETWEAIWQVIARSL